MNQRAVHIWVSGRVQGVNYRHATHHHARKWDITGWVLNLPDHRVELKAFGTQEAIEHLIEWLYRGPPLAHVTELEIVDIPWENHEDFEIIREIPH